MATVDATAITRIHDMEGSLSLTSIGSGPGGSANADIVIQGAQSAARRQSNTTDHGFYLTVTSRDVSGAGVHVGVWFNHLHASVVTMLGVRLASAVGNFERHNFPLAQYPITGGWVRHWVHVGRTPDAAGDAFNKAVMTLVGAVASLPAVSGTIQNLLMDASDFTTTGLALTGTGGVWADFIAADEGSGTNQYGVVRTLAGVLYCLARLTLGAAGTSLAFADNAFVIVFPNQAAVASNFMGITVNLAQAATDIEWNNAVVRSAGAVQGDLVVTGTAGEFRVNNTSLANLRVLTLTSKASFQGCLISGSGLITCPGASVLSSTILGATSSAALLWDANVDPNGKLNNSSFDKGTPTAHAIEFGPDTPVNIGLFGVSFTGYGADGSTSAAVFNNSGKHLNLSILGDGDTPTVRNGDGASTDVITGQRDFSFRVEDSASAPVTGYEWRLYEADPTPGTLGTVELAGEEAATEDTQNYLYTYDADVDVVLQVLHNDFMESITRTTLKNSNQSITVVLRPEENI